MRKILVLTVVLLSAATFLFAATPVYQAKGQAINFTVNDLQNNRVSLSDLKGKPVIMFFWTTWCPFCREEIKNLNSRSKSITDEGIQLLPIDAGEPSQRVGNYIKTKGLSLKVYLDEDGQVAQSYGVMGVPTYIFINKKGQIVFKGNSLPSDYKKYLLE